MPTERTEQEVDQLVDEFRQIARYGWPQAGECTALLGHPMVAHTARDPNDEGACIKALKGLLKKAVADLKKKEKLQGLRYDRSVAGACNRLLRLEKKFDDQSLKKLREGVGAEWKNRDGEPLGGESFRIHHERKNALRPFAHAFLAFAEHQLEKHGVDPKGAGKRPGETVPERMVARLERLEANWHGKRLQRLGDQGSFRIKDEEEMLAVLLAINELAEHGFRAVDHTPIGKWTSKPRLKKYLQVQLKRVEESKGALTLERIRLVADSELTHKRQRGQLANFVKQHEDASATLLLVPIEAVTGLEVSFQPHNGLLLADPQAGTIAVTGRLGEGTVGRALVHTRDGDEVGTLVDEYESLKAAAEENDYDRKLRERLAE